MRLIAILVIVLTVLVPFSGAEEQTANYTAFNPGRSGAPDCRVPIADPPGSLGLGGGCFDIPPGVTRFEVQMDDLVTGPGYGVISLCEHEDPWVITCWGFWICAGHAEGVIPEWATFGSVSSDPGIYTSCGLESIAWVPTHGTITMNFT